MDDLLQPKRQSKLLGTEQQMGLIRKPSLVGNTGTSGGYLSRKDSRELILLREFYTRQIQQHTNARKRPLVKPTHKST